MGLLFMEVILYQPQIPQNTGNIVRTCAVTGCRLVLVRPLGFSTSNRWLKRAGLDYWEGVDVSFLDDLETYLDQETRPFYFLSSKASKTYSHISFDSSAIFIFGSETQGLPDYFWQKWPERFLSIPMIEGVRCLNLATSVGIVLYEAWRQQGFHQ